MSAGSSVNNSWTILAPEEPVAETLRPLAEGTEENHEESPPSLAPAPVSTSEEPDPYESPAAGDEASPAGDEGSPAEGAAVEEQQAPEEKTARLIEDTGTEQHTSVSPDFADAPTSLEDSGVDPVLDSDALHGSGGPPEAPAQASPDPDSFSDSYSHITTPSPDDEPLDSPLRTETLGGAEVTQEEHVEEEKEEEEEEQETVHQINGEEPQQEVDDLSQSDVGKLADSVAPEVNEERIEPTEEEAESELRKRRSLLAVLDQIGRVEEEEEEEDEERAEEFRVPRREEDSGITLNKCILGAIILLGLGTIFFSESDYGTRELKDAEMPVKREWLNPEAPPPPPDADGTELLNKLAEGKEQISVLQAQTQKEELKVAEGQAAEGAPGRLEEMEKENSRLKTEVASLRVLQRENERMKRELESVPALQKELETLRRTVTELNAASAAPEAAQAHAKSTASPPGGHPGDGRPGTASEKQSGKQWNEQKEKKKEWKKEKYDTGKKTEWKESSDRKEGSRKDGGKTERKKEKHEHGRYDKVRDEGGKQKQWKEKEWKKEKVSRGEEAKPWKSKEGKKEWIERSEGKDWKKGKHEKVSEGKHEKKYGEKHSSREEWKGEKEWRKVKDGYKGSGKEKWEGKDWKEKGEKKEWKKDGEKRRKDEKRKGERKQWDDGKSKHGREEWRRKEERKHDHRHGDRMWGDGKPAHTRRHQPDHWVQQRDRLRNYAKAPRPHCQSVEACAQGEGLLPVPLQEFQAVLQSYLSKAEEAAGVAASRTAELRALAGEFFRDGVFVHDQMSFQDFVEDVGDILEDMVEGEEEEEEDGEDSAIEDQMEEFEREVLKKFAAPAAA